MDEKLRILIQAEINDAKSKISEVKNEIDSLEAKEEEHAEKSNTNWLKSIVSTAAVIAAIKKIGDAVVGITKEVVSAYGEYEQLTGGVEKLFGESAGVIEHYASNAYKTAQMSANDYMSTVTSFSASLINSLGGNTLEATRYADQAIKDMADNANTFGTSMESIQNAYQGFAKQNYTMLDNLKLGYGGTKTEMERLLADANKINKQMGINTNYTIDSFADVTAAIHVIQQNMKITGTTAKEASQTIEGSFNSAKAAIENLFTGLGDSTAEVRDIASDALDAVDDYLDNLGEVIETVKDNAPEVIDAIQEQLPELMDTVTGMLNDLVDIGFELIGGFIESLPEMLSHIPDIVGNVAENAVTLVIETVTNLPSILSGIFETIGETVASVFEGITRGIGEAFGSDSLQAAYEFRDSLDGISLETERLNESIAELSENRDKAYAQMEAEVAIYETIRDRLIEYTDEQGHVKEGYENEVQQLIALASQYGINIEYVDGQIVKRGDLIESIGATIESIKAECLAEIERQNMLQALTLEMEAKRQVAEATQKYYAEMEAAAKAEAAGDTWAASEHKRNADELATVISERTNSYIEACKEEELASYNLAQVASGNLDNLASTFEETGVRQEDVINKGKEMLSGYREHNDLEIDKMVAASRRHGDDTVKSYEGMQHSIDTTMDGILETTGLSMEEIEELQKKKFEEMAKDAESGGNDIVKGIAKALDEGKITYKQAMDILAITGQNQFQSTNDSHSPSRVYEGFGRDIVQGLTNGIYNGQSGAVNAISNLAWNMISTAKSVLGIASPSKVFREMGLYSDEGLELGLRDGLPDLVSTLDYISNEMTGAFSPDLSIDTTTLDKISAMDGASIDSSFDLNNSYNSTLINSNSEVVNAIIQMAVDIVTAIENKDTTLDGEVLFNNVVDRNNSQVMNTGLSPLMV